MKFLMFVFLMVFGMTSFAQTGLGSMKFTTETVAVAYSQGLTAVPIGNGHAAAVELILTDATPASGTFTCAATDICTKTAHTFQTGLIVRLTTSAADLPLNLLTGTDYYVVKLSADTFSLATSLANAIASPPVVVDIGDAGTGIHTVTATALAGASVKLQASNDGANWADLPIEATGDATKSVSITVTANKFLSDDEAASKYLRAYYTLSSGQLTGSQITSVKY